MDPVTALRQIAYYKDRNRHDPRRVMAYRNAADIIEGLDDAARQRHGQANSWQSLAGIGPKTAKVIAQAWSGREPDLLAELRADAEDLGGGAIRAALRGDLHLHSNWSDGSAPIEEMMATAAALGHQYCALTDHSPRLTIANGLSPDRLRKQLDVIDELREKFAPLRILTGIEVDILEDGSLDQEPEMLDRLDIVVASVHSKLSMDSAAMTRRMVRAVANGHTDVLGHCTGRLIAGNRGIRPESKFDAEAVFTACREHGTAVEINSRPERRDIITATGLNLQLFGGATATIDGQQVDITTTMAYKGMMLSGIPNMAYTVGYTNASWTLKADLVSEFVCRLLNYMDDNGFDTVVVERPGSDVEERPFMEFTPGYVLRSLDELPKQGSRTPWRLNQNYLRDIRLIRRGKIDDEGLRFAKRPAPVGV